MLCALNGIFQKKNSIEEFTYQFEIHQFVWFLHDRLKEYRKYEDQSQQPIVFRRLKTNINV
jgi:hypothetical protein